MSDDLKENVMDTNIWIRLVFMLLFAVIFAATRVILVAVIAIQFLWVLFTGNKNVQLLSFGSQLATFIYQIYRYLSFNTEKRPFPFDDFPSAEALIDDAVAEAAPVNEPSQPSEKVEPEVKPTEQEEIVEDAVDSVSETGVEADNKQ